MGVSAIPDNPNDDDRRRRLLLGKLGSFMKTSWRRSREILTTDEDGDDGRKKKDRGSLNDPKRSALSVRFQDEVSVIESAPSTAEADEITDSDEERWYGSDDYIRFKKDVILSSLNYVNAKRASKPFNERQYSTRGIEHVCEVDNANNNSRKRREAERKHLHRAIRDEQNRQKRTGSYPDPDKLRSASLSWTKGERVRALARGAEYARSSRSDNNNNNSNTRTVSPSAVKNLFAATKRNKHRRNTAPRE